MSKFLATIAVSAYLSGAWYDCYVAERPKPISALSFSWDHFTPALFSFTFNTRGSASIAVESSGFICGPVTQTINGEKTTVIKDGDCFGSRAICGPSGHCLRARTHIEPEIGPSQEYLFNPPSQRDNI